MGTSVEDLSEWFDRGVEQGATHMIVVCDTFSYEDYPVYVKKGEDVRDVYKKHDGSNMQKVMEVYSLTKNKTSQLQGGTRVFNFD